VLAHRVIAISPDKAFGKQLAIALKAAGGTIDSYLSLDAISNELQAALVVMHLDGELAGASAEILGRLVGDTRVIAVLPRSNLAAVVDIMQANDRVAGMMVAENLDVNALSAMATRILAGDIFGLEKYVPWGTLIHSHLVGDFQEKSNCIAQVSEFAEAMSVRRKYREGVEQCLDEMLMNALYDAPVDEQGRQIFAEIPTKTRISLRVEQKAVVQYACDGKQFVLAVRDAFGTLERATVLRYLHKCLHAEQQIDRKVGGAGLGLYLMVNAASEVYFNVLPGVATEAVCVFDLVASKLQLQTFGFFHEKIDAAGHLAAGPSRRLPAGTSHPVERRAPRAQKQPKGLIALLVVAIAVTLGLVALAASKRGGKSARAAVTIDTVPRGATVEIEGKNAGTTGSGALVVPDLEIGHAYPIAARLDGHEPASAVVQPRKGGSSVTLQLAMLAPTLVLDSQPTGAAVEVDGQSVGTTPLSLTSLAPKQPIAVTFKKAGYETMTLQLAVPHAGKELRVVQPLAISRALAKVKLTSDPPGAQVVQNGQTLAGVTTPAEILVEAGKPVRFTLALPNKVPATIEPFTPARGSDDIVKHGKLVDGQTLSIASTIEGKATVTGVPHCQALETPATCVLVKGDYVVDIAVPNAPKLTRKITVGSKPISIDLALGTVEAAKGESFPGGARRLVLEAGSRQVTLVGKDGTHAVTVVVKAGATVVAR
jgi:PEGA domain